MNVIQQLKLGFRSLMLHKLRSALAVLGILIGVTAVIWLVAAVKEAGGNPKYTELPGVGHDSWTAAYHDEELLDWFFKQHR